MNKDRGRYMRELQVLISIGMICLYVTTGCRHERSYSRGQFESDTLEDPDIVMDSANLIPVEPADMVFYPCSDCHSVIEPNPQRRELVGMHDDIVYDHDSENRWCLACHSTDTRDSLVLAGGQLIGFDESYRLCGQCHGPKFRDWKRGIHGKRTGEWNGKKQYLLCVHCHNPHSPEFKKMEPLPPPRRPGNIQADSTYEAQEESSESK